MKKIATLLLVAASFLFCGSNTTNDEQEGRAAVQASTLASVKTANAQQKLNRGYSLNEAEAKIYLAKFGK